MPKITFLPGRITQIVEEGSDILEAAKLAGMSVEAPCGGRGICGKCLVKIESGKVDFDNSGIIPEGIIEDGYVLICRSKATSEDTEIQILSSLDDEAGSFSDAKEDIFNIDKTLLPIDADFMPLVNKLFLKVSQPEAGDGLSDLDRLRKAIDFKKEIDISVGALRKLPEMLREHGGDITITYHSKCDSVKIIDVESSDTSSENYGVAIDIGTTTVAVQLVNLVSGHIIASKTDYNQQIECGLDVISRINYATKPSNLEELRQKVLLTINKSIAELSEGAGITHILNASIAGNTTMVHLLLGIAPEHIRLEPYTPAVYNVPNLSASEIGISIFADSECFIAPSVGSYVGGDITSGLLCTNIPNQTEQISLLIDIGTNGELILGNADFMIGCACSAGPAFEGGGIQYGMRASHGAIERVEVDPVNASATVYTIGNDVPKGICGSGMISLIAELFSKGWIDAAGKLDRTRKSPNIEVVGRVARYKFFPDSNSEMYIDETDIDNIIRAKAAIFSACRIMLQKVHMDFDSLSKVYIAGGFGRYIDIDNAVTIGLLPKLPKDRFVFIGNSSIIGAYMTLISQKHREKEIEISKTITYIDLSTELEYMDQYMAALFIPHTDVELFKDM